MPIVLLSYYCVFILLASIVGGMIPVWFQLTHRGMQFAVSFVAGVMLGVGVLHMLPHALIEAVSAPGANRINAVWWTMFWLLAGMLAMFFIERFFCFHHHDVDDQVEGTNSAHDHQCAALHAAPNVHHHDLSWTGSAFGLTLHTVLNGVALAAAVEHAQDGAALAGFGTFLVIFLHKPLDAMTIGTLMARGGRSLAWRHTVNALFSLAIPLGVLLFYFGLKHDGAGGTNTTQSAVVAYALAFSAGTFLCISLSDLLPELQFHQHDRVKLSIALLLGLAVAMAASRFESAGHTHNVQTTECQRLAAIGAVC
jgi:zinc and cadmium transporter